MSAVRCRPFLPHGSAGFLIALFIAIPLLYLVYLPVSYSFDGTVFSHMLRYALLKHDWLTVVQLHHLLYFPCAHLAYRLLQACCRYRVLEYFHLQLFSMFFGLGTLLLVERLLKKLALNLWLRMAGVAAIACAHAFWLYSVDAEVHIPGIFFTLAGMYVLIFRKETAAALAGAALCFAVAAGFHLTNALIVATVLFYLLVRRAPWRHFAVFLGVFFASLALMYAAFAALSGRPILATLFQVLFSPNAYSGYRHSAFHPPTPQAIATSLLTLKSALAAGTGFFPWLLGAAFLLLLALAVYPRLARNGTAFRQGMLLWSLPFFIFFSLWDRGNMEFKIHALLPLLLIAITGLARLKPALGTAIGLGLSAGLLLVNLTFSIRPKADIRNNVNYQAAVDIRKATPENAQVMIAGNYLGYGYGKIYIPYFARREVIILDWLLGKGRSLAAIRTQLERVSRSGRPLFALAEIAEPGEAVKKLLDFHHVREDDFLRFRSAIRFVPGAMLANGQRLYRMELMPSGK